MCEKVSSVTCRWSVVSSGCSGFLHQKTDFIIISPPWYDPGCCWGVKPLNQPNPCTPFLPTDAHYNNVKDTKKVTKCATFNGSCSKLECQHRDVIKIKQNWLLSFKAAWWDKKIMPLESPLIWTHVWSLRDESVNRRFYRIIYMRLCLTTTCWHRY